MCGIAGIFCLKGKGTRLAKPLLRMTKSMFHRGPDDEGYFLAGLDGCKLSLFGDDTPLSTQRHNDSVVLNYPREHIKTKIDVVSQIGFGHRRLSIVDLSPFGHQPMGSADQRYWIVYNGEIYNFAEIANELKKRGIHLYGKNDTEVLLNAYILWGETCLAKFNGMFALAIWDAKEKFLFCARDRIGIKPFYYTIQNNLFIFGSDIKALIASGLYHPMPDMEGLYLSMAFGIAPRPKTAFKDVVALEQGHWMRIYLDGKIEQQKYWSIPIGTQDINMTEGEAVELLEDRLTASIRRRLIADVSVGTFMSGGIDSTTISAIASDLQPGIKAFTLAFENTAPELDEVAQAQATAKLHPMEHIVHRVNPFDSLKDLQFWIDGYEEPFYSLAPNYVISKLVRKNGVKVVLNGLGGDELFAGYGMYSHVGRWRLLRMLRSMAGVMGLFVPKHREIIKTLSMVKSADRYHTASFVLSPDNELQQLFSDFDLHKIDTVETLHEMYAEGLHFTDDIEAISYMDLMNYVGNHHVHRSDQFSMAHSVESRFPFLDHEVVAAAFKIPSRLKINGKIQKYVLRKVAKKYIAPECLSMKKKGFGLPLKQWMDGPLKIMTSGMIRELAQREEIQGEIPDLWLRQYQAGKRSYSQVWHLVALEMWFRTFIDKGSVG